MFRLALVAACLLPLHARAEVGECHVVSVNFTPAMNANPSSGRHELSQIVVWIEKPDGSFVDTIYMTAQTGRFGLGNRPGRWDFNAGPMFPYGRRIQTFPVWAHRKMIDFPGVVFQNCCGPGDGSIVSDDPAYCETLTNDPTNPDPQRRRDYAACGENNLSHPFNDSSRELHYCQPFQPSDSKWVQADAMTCATQAYTDKGKFSTTTRSLYPPRADLMKATTDSMSVDMYKALNAFDAISQATPAAGQATSVTWPIPADLSKGDYVAWVEVAQAFDTNDTYNPTSYPAPAGTGPKYIEWSSYGMPYRGQPSIVYRVPFSIGDQQVLSNATTYEGYGDPTGADGALHPPDATITTDTPGSGGSRLQLVSSNGQMYRVQVDARPEFDYAMPGAPEGPELTAISTTTATLQFVAPGDDGLVGKASGYEIRYLADKPLTDENFDAGIPALTTITPGQPGQLESVQLMGLLPETEYTVGVRAFDDCHNTGPTMFVQFTTADRQAGEVDACFVATAAYGSLMANDVELLRHVRDAALRRTVFGELFVETYYTFGPAVAGVVGESDVLRATARGFLAPIVKTVRKLSY
jgi:hypothetical protein